MFHLTSVSPLLLFGGLGAAIVLVLLTGMIVQFLWNTTIPDLVGVRRIAYWEAVRLFLLTSLLFGGAGVGLGLGA